MNATTFKVTAVCPTFGRFPDEGHLLNGAVQCFLDQTVDDAELLILNDAPAQELVFKHPRVRVLNTTFRYPTLGEKRNACLAHARGRIILPWDDDDIHLPNRIEQAISMLEGYDYWNPHGSWYLNPYETGGQLSKTHRHGICHNASAFRAGAVWYNAVSGPEDRSADARAASRGRVNPATLTNAADWTYVYRFGVSFNHVSGVPEPRQQAGYAARTATPGRFFITPKQERDWGADIARALLPAPPAAPAAPAAELPPAASMTKRPTGLERLLGRWLS